jgi:hypothetical protein
MIPITFQRITDGKIEVTFVSLWLCVRTNLFHDFSSADDLSSAY